MTKYAATSVEEEIRLRIKVAVCAYAYEYRHDQLIEDLEYDELSRSIDTAVATGNEELDTFFKEEFSADTGMWVHKHPDIASLDKIYLIIKRSKR